MSNNILNDDAQFYSELLRAFFDSANDAIFVLCDEMKLLVNESRAARDSVGSIKIGPNKEELSNLKFRRSLYVVEDLLAGDTLTQKNVRSIRPSNGLHPRYLDIILGKKISKNVKKGTPLSWNLL